MYILDGGQWDKLVTGGGEDFVECGCWGNNVNIHPSDLSGLTGCCLPLVKVDFYPRL